MYYKLSNTSKSNSIEKAFNATFKFPHLHLPNPIINGLNEEILPLITSDNRNEIAFGIWGILPEDYNDDWENYQKIQNTLNTTLADVSNHNMTIFNPKKCVIAVSGFFTNFLKDGEVYTYYVHQKSEKPFLLGGIYNTLGDGFKTCSLVLTSASPFIKKINNLSKMMPVVIDDKQINNWLDTPLEFSENTDHVFNMNQLYAHTIEKQFYENNVLFDSVLKPKIYEDIPGYVAAENLKESKFT